MGFALLALIVLVAGAVIWLRTDSGLNFAAKKALSALEGTGLSLSWTGIEGPLPEKLIVQGLVANDKLGRFAQVDRLELNLKPGSLMGGLLEITALNVSGLNLERRPEMEPSPDTPDSSSGLPPINIKARFDVSGFLANQVLAPQSNDPSAGKLDLKGNFSLTDGAISAQLATSWLDDTLRGVELTAALSQGQGGAPDELKILVSARDGAGGPLSYLLDRPDWPAWSLSVNGQGPLTGWQGQATLALLDPKAVHASSPAPGEAPSEAPNESPGEAPVKTASPNATYNDNPATDLPEASASGQAQGENVLLAQNPASPLTYVATAKLSIAGKNGTIKGDLIDNRSLRLSLSAQLGPEAPIPIPDEIFDLIGRDLELFSEVDLEGPSIKGDLLVKAPKATVSILGLDFLMVDGGFDLTGNGQIAFDPTLAAALANKNSTDGSKNGQADFDQTALSSVPTESEVPLFSDAPYPPLPPTAAGAAPNEAEAKKDPGDWLTFGYDLNLASKDNRFEIKDLSLTGTGLTVKGAGTMDPDAGKKANLDLGLSQDSKLWPTVMALIGSESKKSGSLALKTQLSQNPEGLLNLETVVNLTELDLLASPWGGPVTVILKANGPVEKLTVDLGVNSPKLLGPREDLPDVNFAYKGQVLGLPNFQGANGHLALTTGNFASGPIELSTDFDFSLPAQTTAQAAAQASQETPVPAAAQTTGQALNQTSAQAAGQALEPSPDMAMDANLKNLTLSAGPNKELLDLESPALSLSLRPGSVPAPRGSLKLKVGDWKTVGALTGLDLSGSPASLEASLDPAGSNENSAQVKLDLPELKMGQDLHIKGLVLDLEAKDYLTALNYQINLNASQSQLGPIGISKARVEGQGDGRKADLKVELLSTNGSELLTLSGNGDLVEKKAVIDNLKLASIPQLPGGLKLNQPVTISFMEGLSLSQTVISMGRGGTVDVSGSLEPLKIKAKLVDFALDNLSGLSDQVPQGQANLTLDYDQSGAGSFELTAKFTAPPALESLAKILNVTANGKFEPRSVSGKITLNQTRLQTISVDYRLPLIPEGKFFKPDMDGPLSAAMTWKGPFSPIWNLIGLTDRAFTGELDLDLKIEGSAKAPKPVVNAYLANGQYQDLVLGLLVSHINMEIHDQADGNLKLLLEASDSAEGKLSLEGTVKPFASPPSISVRGQLRRLAPLRRDDSSAIITGLAHLDGPFTALTISAKVVVEQAEIDLDMIRGGGSITTLDLQEKLTRVSYGPSLALDVDLPRQIFIRGRGLDSEWGGHVNITNPFGRILLNGSLKPLNGTFDLLSKQFKFTGGDIRFMNSPKINPALNVELTRQTSSLQANVKVTGFVQRPVLTLTSQPPYPSDEVLSQVLFGKKVSQLSRMEALQLANSLRVMAGLGGDIGLQVLSTMRDALGLSVLRVSDTSDNNSNRILGGNTFRDNLNLDKDSQSTDTTTLEAGRYIGDNIYVGLEQNLTDNTTGVRVEVELTPNISLQSLSSPTSNRVGLGWKKDY
ncbi:MAG: translocation/assembly module TamB domain-containing protein [Deltaproteobacteria bacterium]|nr:translocation/assembly module TamB domain-containing protein [Deltaproteobacteria bacterium]